MHPPHYTDCKVLKVGLLGELSALFRMSELDVLVTLSRMSELDRCVSYFSHYCDKMLEWKQHREGMTDFNSQIEGTAHQVGKAWQERRSLPLLPFIHSGQQESEPARGASLRRRLAEACLAQLEWSIAQPTPGVMG